MGTTVGSWILRIGLLVTVGVGLVEGPVEIVIALIAVALSRYVSVLAGRSALAERTLGRVPVAFRYVIGLALVTVVGRILMGPRVSGTGFRGLVITAAIGMVIFSLVLTPQAGPIGTGTVALILAAGLTGVLLVLNPTPALADNCSGASDCNGSTSSTAGAAAGAAALATGATLAKKPAKPGKEYGTLINKTKKNVKPTLSLFEIFKQVWNGSSDNLAGAEGGPPEPKPKPDLPDDIGDFPDDRPAPEIPEFNPDDS